MSGFNTQLDNLLRAASPAFDKASSVEDVGDHGISGAGPVVPLQVIHLQSERKNPITPYFQAVVIDCQTDRPSSLRIVAMANRINQGFSECCWRKDWLVDTLKQARPNASGHR